MKKNNTVKQPSSSIATLFHARICSEENNHFEIDSDQGRFWAKKAISCLLQPNISDLVLISYAGESAYILQILERPIAGKHTLNISDSVKLIADNNQLSIQANQISLEANHALTIKSDAALLEINEAHIKSEHLSLSGTTYQSAFVQTSEVAARRFIAAERQENHLGERIQKIAGHDDLSAGSARLAITADLTMDARDVTVSAEQCASIQAKEQIQLG